MREFGGVRDATAVWACALVFATVACGKTEAGGASEPTGDAGRTNAAAGAGGSGAGDATSGATAEAGNGGESIAESGAPAEDDSPLTALPGALRRLTAPEYAATVTDVLGTTQTPDLAPFSTQVDGFDNNAAANGVSDPLYFRYLETAEALADEVFASNTLRLSIVTCTQADDAVCIRQVIMQAGLRLFRRPLLEDELAAYQRAYARARTRAESHEGALKEVLIALLASAQFLYRMEFVPSKAGTQPLGPYELATRLSYLLWSSAPDSTLLDAAQRSQLASNEQLTATVKRLLDDPKARRFVQNFAGQWLGSRRLTSVSFDPKLLPQWTPEVAAAAASEIEASFSELLGQDQLWFGFLDSRAHFINPPLAGLYGLTVTGPGTQRVELGDADRRGFLGLVGFLAQNSAPSRSSPSERGAWIARNLLCTSLPEPPADMPSFPDKEPEIRAYLRGLSSDCSGCHAQFDALGLVLERYDAIGRYRTAYPDATVIDAQVTLPASLASADATGLAGLSQALASAPAFTACTVQKLYTYGFGRAFTEAERPNVQALAQQWRSGPLTMRELIFDLVRARTFRARSDGGSQ